VRINTFFGDQYCAHTCVGYCFYLRLILINQHDGTLVDTFSLRRLMVKTV